MLSIAAKLLLTGKSHVPTSAALSGIDKLVLTVVGSTKTASYLSHDHVWPVHILQTVPNGADKDWDIASTVSPSFLNFLIFLTSLSVNLARP